VLTEADSRLGLANRLLASRAYRVCLAFPIPGREGDRYRLTGRPVPRAVIEAGRAAARARFGLGEGERCLTVFGGSQGSRSINEAALAAFAEGDGGTRVIHVTGRRDYPELARRWQESGSPQRYLLLEYEPTLGEVLAASDLVLARAGGSVMEIAAAGRPAVLVPYPHATGDHQAANARWMADGGAAIVLTDSELTPERLRAAVGALLDDGSRLEEMSAASRRLAKPEAAELIAREVLEAAADA
jgi:UDP-N-acetylglucosamine--N-acetylmuramyl-(pentapeptide) pyrophosphoryl-undecaprenol N-acetylglucosamine transferase